MKLVLQNGRRSAADEDWWASRVSLVPLPESSVASVPLGGCPASWSQAGAAELSQSGPDTGHHMIVGIDERSCGIAATIAPPIRWGDW